MNSRRPVWFALAVVLVVLSSAREISAQQPGAGIGERDEAAASPVSATSADERALEIERIRADRRQRRAVRRWSPRAPGWALRLTMGGYLGETGIQVGGLMDASVVYRPEAPVFLGVDLDPFGLIRADGERVGLFGIRVIVGYESDSMLLAVTGGSQITRIYQPTRRIAGATPIVGIQFRIGAEEGLHVLVRAEAVFIGRRPSSIIGHVEARFPTLGPAIVGVVRGGLAGLAHMETGLRFGLDRASERKFFITPTVGLLLVDLQLRQLVGYTASLRLERSLAR